MVACQLESEEKKEENKMVTLAVTIDEELLRMLGISVHLGEDEIETGIK